MYKKILVAVDGSDTSKLALKEALKIGKACKSQLRIIYVEDSFYAYPDIELISVNDLRDSMRQEGEKILAKVKKRIEPSGIRYELLVLETNPKHPRIAEVIAAEASKWRAELIIAGTHGRRGFDHLLLGSVAESIMRVATKPVLLVRGS